MKMMDGPYPRVPIRMVDVRFSAFVAKSAGEVGSAAAAAEAGCNTL
jgi:hypothetical protein